MQSKTNPGKKKKPYDDMGYSLRLIICLSMFLCCFLAASSKAFSSKGNLFLYEQGEARLITDLESVGEKRKLIVGLHFKMKSGWKIYWRSPGAAGFPPNPNWTGSRNVLFSEILWPIPERFSVIGLETIGYQKEVVLLTHADIPDPSRAVSIKAKIPFLTCNLICVPHEAKLSLLLLPGQKKFTPEQAVIETYLGRIPWKGNFDNLEIISADIASAGGQATLRIEARKRSRFLNPDIFIENSNGFIFDIPKVEILEGGQTAIFRTKVQGPINSKGRVNQLIGQEVILTLSDGGRAIEKNLTIKTNHLRPDDQQYTKSARADIFSKLLFIGLALLGGLILNFMPCVLPVLSLKLLSVIRLTGTERVKVRRGFLATACGIWFSFLVLAAVVFSLKQAGQVIGWGIQFQQPLFLSFLMAVILLFAANTWGFFAFSLPGFIQRPATGLVFNNHFLNHFFTGAFATLLATPCSAPFLGTAVGFAMGSSGFQIFGIFLLIGIGFSLPYLLVSGFPSLVGIMPRPGPWMIIFKRFLALGLFVTALWLLSIIMVQVEYRSLLMGLSVITVAVAGMFIYWRAFKMAAAVLATSIVIGFLAGSPHFNDLLKSPKASNITWQQFRPGSITAIVASGRVVFVDVTADWCITCKANKHLVLESKDVSERLNTGGVIPMQADWTRADPIIAEFLKRYGRYGIPFNIVFGPKFPRGLILPEVLTESAVLDALVSMK